MTVRRLRAHRSSVRGGRRPANRGDRHLASMARQRAAEISGDWRETNLKSRRRNLVVARPGVRTFGGGGVVVARWHRAPQRRHLMLAMSRCWHALFVDNTLIGIRGAQLSRRMSVRIGICGLEALVMKPYARGFCFDHHRHDFSLKRRRGTRGIANSAARPGGCFAFA